MSASAKRRIADLLDSDRTRGRRLGGALAVVAFALATPADAQPPPASSKDFAAAASGADTYEIMAGRLALVESHDPAIRGFAETMMREHAAARDALDAAAARSGLTRQPPVVGADQAPLLAGLQGARGKEFDRAYVRQQVVAHRGALAAAERYAREGSDANLRAAAQAELPMIREHLRAATQIEAAEGG